MFCSRIWIYFTLPATDANVDFYQEVLRFWRWRREKVFFSRTTSARKFKVQDALNYYAVLNNSRLQI